MGLDIFQVQDVVEQKSIFENSVNLVLDIMRTPQWINPLKIYKPQMMQQQMIVPGQIPQQYLTGNPM